MKEQEPKKLKTQKQTLKCSNCGKVYRLNWTLQIHERLCKQRKEAIEKHPERYF